MAETIGKSKTTISESLSLNRLPQAIRDECRKDPTVPKKVLVEIARKKQERSMLTKFQQYRDKQAKAAAKAAEAGPAATPKRTKTEALAEGIGIMTSKIGDVEFPDLSAEERVMLIESMNSLKETLDEAIPRAVNNKRKPM
jgi:ParB family chromosome partitioning protein